MMAIAKKPTWEMLMAAGSRTRESLLAERAAEQAVNYRLAMGVGRCCAECACKVDGEYTNEVYNDDKCTANALITPSGGAVCDNFKNMEQIWSR